jgi:cytochrome c peroxidase
MKKLKFAGLMLLALAAVAIFNACKKDAAGSVADPVDSSAATQSYPAIAAAFGDNIDPASLENYATQSRPAYINRDNSGANPVTDAGATLGRVLFYDKKLSVNNTIACAGCHKQAFAFGDTAVRSLGVNGSTGRHSMRLVNARFSQELRFFWDERAASLEAQTTRPIQDHAEMGYSGQNGDPAMSDLLAKLQAVDYYRELFTLAFGDEQVTEDRMQRALSQFIRSIQSFDSKFDAGLAQVNNLNQDFPNFTAQENQGKRLFLAPPPGAPGNNGPGAGCQVCHRAPEFDIDPNSRNNGIVGVPGSPGLTDFINTRSPSLRNLLNTAGVLNGPLMHDGSLANLAAVVDHYNLIAIVPGNNNLDPRLRPAGQPQNLQLSQQQKDAIVAFLGTLSGQDVYSNKKWSDPFIQN